MKLAGWGECKRGAAIVLAIVLSAAALAAMLVAVAWAAPRLEFLHIRRNLSQTGDRLSAYPDLAISPDGDRVVVVWTEGHDQGADYKGHVYLRAASESGGGWGGKVRVFSGGDSACAYRAAVAVTGTTAHVAYVVFSSPCHGHSFARVGYKTCPLTGDEGCSPEEQVVTVSTSDHDITSVDLALDAEGNPHVVWMRYVVDGVTRHDAAVFYRSKADGIWRDPEGGEVVAIGDDDRDPAIACADGYAHVVWEKESQDAIWYRRRDVNEDGGPGAWDDPRSLYSWNLFPPANPDVAAGAGRVFVAWDVRYDDPKREVYSLIYKRSNNSGEGGDFGGCQEIGVRVWPDWYDLTTYEPTGHGNLPRLRPSIALNRDGWPAVAWHAGHSADTYAVYYSYATTGTDETVDWITPTVLAEGTLGAAAVGVGQPQLDGGQHLHVAYMRSSGGAWDVYYDSDEGDRYGHICLPLVMRVD